MPAEIIFIGLIVLHLLVVVMLVAVRDRTFAPWIWVPLIVWDGSYIFQSGLAVLMVYQMPEAGGLGSQQVHLLLLSALLHIGLFVAGGWKGFPREKPWRKKAWIGGLCLLIGIPLSGSAMISSNRSPILLSFVLALLPALVLWVLLFPFRKRGGVPWIWVPVMAWSVWGGASLLPTFLPRDPIYGPPEWSPYGFDALFVAVALAFFGLVIFGGLTAFPRRSAWRVKPWVGGIALAVGLPFIVWITCTIPCTLQLIGPDGNPVKGVGVYKLIPGKGSRLADVDTKVSDDDGVVRFRKFPSTQMELWISGSGSWEGTQITISPPGNNPYPAGVFDFTQQVTLTWGRDVGSAFVQAFRSRPDLARNPRAGLVSGQAAWILRDGAVKKMIPVHLHSGGTA